MEVFTLHWDPISDAIGSGLVIGLGVGQCEETIIATRKKFSLNTTRELIVLSELSFLKTAIHFYGINIYG